MRPLPIVVVASILPLAAPASEADPGARMLAMTEAGAAPAAAPGAADGAAAALVAAAEAGGGADRVVEGLEVRDAAGVALAEYLWVRRPILVFADTPADPAFQSQVENILGRAAEFAERDVVLILDTDPAARSEARQRLRPRGFMLAIMDKDGEVKQRRPAPRTAREVMAVIDRFPLRRQEMLERRPSGRD